MKENFLTRTQSPVVWVLIDNRVGNANQALALADQLGLPYETKFITYNKFAKLPNFLISLYPLHVDDFTLRQLKSYPIPEIIISAGRRTSALALYLKRLSKNKTSIIQIMRPVGKVSEFDFIILPQHDSFEHVSPAVLRILGALTNVSSRLEQSKEVLHQHYPEAKNFIAVMIGGASKKYDFSEKSANSLLASLKTISDNHFLPLFVSFSRRTPARIKELFKKELSWPHIIYDPDSNMPNPYPGIIASASYIVTTADSISMCSEAASTGNPVYVFCPENFKLKKHKFFIQQLMDLGIVRVLEEGDTFLEDYPYEPLNEAARVAELILSHDKFNKFNEHS